MASYVEGVLAAGEEILYRGQVSLWPYSGKLIVGVFMVFAGVYTLASGGAGLGAGIMLAVGAGMLAMVYVAKVSTELVITNKRIMAKFGFIRRSTIEMNIGKVESVQVDQSLLGRMFNYGTIVVSGAGNPQAPVPKVARPLDFRRVFTETADQLQAKVA